MKQKINILLIIFQATLFISNYAQNATTSSIQQEIPLLQGNIRFRNQNSPIPEYTILFRGSQTSSTPEGLFNLPLDPLENISQLSLIFVKRIKYNFETTNTIQSISVPENEPYLFYRITDKDDKLDIKQDKLSEQKNIIPDDALIISINPKYLEKIEPWNINLPTHIKKLPSIILSDNTKQQKASTKSLLYGLDSKVFHEAKIHSYKLDSKVKVSLVK